MRQISSPLHCVLKCVMVCTTWLAEVTVQFKCGWVDVLAFDMTRYDTRVAPRDNLKQSRLAKCYKC